MEKKNDLLLSVSQRPVLAQSLRFSLKILEMNNVDLQEFINDSLNDNPFLKDNEEGKSIYRKLSIDTVTDIAAPISSKDELFKQIAFFRFNEKEKEITSLLYEYVLEHKYVCGDFLRYLSKEKNISYGDLLDIVKKLQTVSPRGMFSFNLQDKIRNILEASGKYDAEHKIFVQHLPILFNNGLAAFKKHLNFDDLTLYRIICNLKNIGLYDGIDNSSECLYRPVDITIEKRNSNCKVEIGEVQIPSVDRKLCCDCLKKIKSKQDEKYIKEKIADAELLIKSIHYRNSTLFRIVQEIAHRQNDFFMGNTAFLVPIEVKSIANSIMCHQSTVHRAITNKTVATPYGIFDIRALMPRGIKSDSDVRIATDHSVKKYIQTLIINEPKDSPYSDSDIVYFLEGRGITISRRTVAKYRNDLDIANSNERLKDYSLTKI